MDSNRWQRVKDIFQAALERDPHVRTAFVRASCAGDEELRREVESLLASSDKEGSFIDSPAYEAQASILAGGHEMKTGATIAHYEIIRTPKFDPIRNDARFQNLLKRIGFQA